MTTLPRRNVSISLPADMADELENWAERDQTSRSAVVVRMMQAERRRRLDAELELAYREMTEDGFFDDVELYLPAAAEVVLAEPYEPEARGALLAGLESGTRQRAGGSATRARYLERRRESLRSGRHRCRTHGETIATILSSQRPSAAHLRNRF